LTLTFKLDQETEKLNQWARYLDQMWFYLKVIIWMQTHTQLASCYT